MSATLELNLARNCFGPLTPAYRRRLHAVIDNPCQETWEEAYSIMLNAEEFTTLWQAVIAVDPTYPTIGPRSTTDRRGRELSRETWARIPTRETILAALRYATH